MGWQEDLGKVGGWAETLADPFDWFDKEDFTGPKTQESSVKPYGPSEPYLQALLPQLQNQYFQNGRIAPPNYGPSAIAGPSRDELDANMKFKGAFGRAEGIAGQGYDMAGQLMQGVQAPASATADYGRYDSLSKGADYGARLKELTQAYSQPAIDIFNEQVLPGISDTAQATGGVGGSRENLFKSLAASRLGRDIGQISAQVGERERDRTDTMNRFNVGVGQQEQGRADAMNQFYTQANLASKTAGINAIPTLGSAQNNALSWLDLIGQRGSVREQAKATENKMRFDYNRDAPRMAMEDYQRQLLNIAGAGRTAVTPNPNYQTGLQAAVGLGTTLYGMGQPKGGGGL